jgi:hypothetical protein
MRILLVSRAFPPAPFSGALRARNLARTFVQAGHEVHVITASGERPPRAEVSAVKRARCWASCPVKPDHGATDGEAARRAKTVARRAKLAVAAFSLQ